jgi:hypothetical protein
VNAICAGAYIVHLKRWVAAHTPSQFLLLSFTEYIAQPGRTLAAIGDHLGIASKEVQQELIANIRYSASYRHIYHTPYTMCHTLIHSYTHTPIHSFTHTLIHPYIHTRINQRP